MQFLGYRREDWKLSLVLGSLVIGQSVPGFLLVTVLPTIYRTNGLDLGDFWIFSLASIPVWLKWSWAPIVDRYGSEKYGRRLSWIVPCTLLGALSYVGLLQITPTRDALYMLVALFFLQRLIMATQDIAVDGYTVDSLQPGNRELASVVIAACDSIAYVAAVAGLLAVYDNFGWGPSVICAAAALIIFTFPAMLRGEPPVATASLAGRPSLVALLRRPGTPAILALMFISGLSSNFIWSIFGAFLIDKGFTLTDAGLALGIAAVPGTLLGGAIAAPLIRRAGEIAAMRIALAGPLLCLPAFLYLSSADAVSQPAVMFVVFWSVLVTMPMNSIFFTSRLRWAAGEQAGTDFTVQSSTQYFGKSVAVAVAGFAAAQLGWAGFFMLSSVLAIAFGAMFIVAAPKAAAAGSATAPHGHGGRQPA